MKYQLLTLMCVTSTSATAQMVQLGYDVRHSVDPEHNPRNFVTASFETFEMLDYGSLLMKVDADLNRTNGNLGRLFVQISQDLKLWDLPVLAHLEYSGGMGFIGGTESAFQIPNTYSLGAMYPFPLLDSWATTFLAYRYTQFDRASHDVVYSFWWGRDLMGPVSATAYFVVWTVNRNRGDAWTQDLDGKKLSGLGEPQIWFNVNERFAVGSEVRLYYQIYDYSEHVLVYPTFSIKYEF